MTEEQIKEHVKEIMQHAADIVSATSDEQWQNYKKVIVENGGSPVPKEIEENIRAVFNYAYGQGICVGMEDTILRYNAMLNIGKGGEA